MDMKNKSYLRESIECYAFVFIFSIFFFGGIIVVGEVSGHSWIGLFPDFSWDIINTWSEVKKGSS